ncbi:hypothetical protein DFH07DRAFT_768107 [Mycena maculata]|uniref:Protein transport protein SEC23 n=1 Tax=Mycena maculata TaxID=230809 RepID=A0AAD7JWN0_9AGAR|nr:hypothetical protein DFH07DRAFT_768107 [Mycena maculata]
MCGLVMQQWVSALFGFLFSAGPERGLTQTYSLPMGKTTLEPYPALLPCQPHYRSYHDHNTGGCIMLFAGGPATKGPGMVVSNELQEPIRSHHDTDRDSVKHFKRATKSFLRLFNKDEQGHLQMGFNATFDVQTTKEDRNWPNIGLENQCHHSSYLVYFEVVTPAGQPLQPGSRGLIQFRLRVTTIARNFAEARSPSIAASFDRETATDLLADRFPIPRYIVCDQGVSQARFLLSKLNLSTTHMSNNMYGSTQNANAGQAIFTDDVSLQVFMEHLKQLASCFLHVS